MINSYLENSIRENFSHRLTLEQETALKSLSEFLLSSSIDATFVLRGYAGTGKTSLVGALVKAMDILQQKTVLLAPTGRAAKVFSAYAKHPAYTIHKKIYRQRAFSNNIAGFSINDNLNTHTLFIVDEASMISNERLSESMFGTGRLLDDLIHFVYSGEGCRLLLIGDTAQLPPVHEQESPALSTEILKSYGLYVWEMNLMQVVRQVRESGILWNATRIRQLITENKCLSLPKIRQSDFTDIQVLSGNELIDTLTGCYEREGWDETIVICRSNKRANIYNKGIRQSILYREEELNTGDWLMIAKNNYYWTEGNKEMEFIANGDMAVVRRIRRTKELYGFRFAEALLSFPDYEDRELDVNLLLDTLQSDTPTLSKEENDKLFYNVLEDYADIPTKRERMKKMKSDPYYNALQVKYAYAVTCHKAQGGQWKNVFLDQGYLKEEFLTPDYFRWLYTAFTRATQGLYLIDYPQGLLE
ncbi:ATP-dependent RecD-like DNA helicase [termite gut metagenome]|uniref:ATP-dependent RecD-like DNA helicase n=1 Tax=termite gut metagenome TaxID=433724 RepID=A0A5J4STL6_9ZZZZ